MNLYLIHTISSLLLSLVSAEQLVHFEQVVAFPYKFSTSLNNDYILGSYNNTDDCKHHCNINSECLGFAYINENNTCNLLNNLGDTSHTHKNITGYKKYMRFYDTDRHSIYGTVITTDSMFNDIPTHIYLDINHNGAYDLNEPLTIAYNGSFNFTDLKKGVYLIREIVPNRCTQLFPSLIKQSHNLDGDGFVDSVYYVHKHKNTNFSRNNILGNKYNTSVVFYPGEEVILTFIDETVINREGNDIIVETGDYTGTYINVSVSNNGQYFDHLGTIQRTSLFDLGNSSFQGPVTYIKLIFFGNDIGIKLKSVKGFSESLSSPHNSYITSIPLSDKKRNKVDIFVFINDCHYYYPCFLHCMFSTNTNDDIFSCMSGCNMAKIDYSCNCTNRDNYPYNSSIDKINEDMCRFGCEYNIGQLMYPDFYIYANSTGTLDKNRIINTINKDYCNKNNTLNCLIDIRNDCKTSTECNSISIDENSIINYFEFKRLFKQNSYLFVKNKHIGDNEIDYETTQTTTPTTTP